MDKVLKLGKNLTISPANWLAFTSGDLGKDFWFYNKVGTHWVHYDNYSEEYYLHTKEPKNLNKFKEIGVRVFHDVVAHIKKLKREKECDPWLRPATTYQPKQVTQCPLDDLLEGVDIWAANGYK